GATLKNNAGFSVIELLIAIAIVAILATVGVPAYTNLTSSNRMAMEISSLSEDLEFTKTEAIKRGQYTSICSSSDGKNCSGSTNWQNGWIVFTDPTHSGTTNSSSTLLRIQKAFSAADTLTANNSINFISFNREGFAYGLPPQVTLTLKDASAKAALTRCLTVTFLGKISTSSYQAGVCQ
ncbi:MAG TPA: GspH/FimT family pseudopilin, partial [Pseudomonadales bacterium]|nr:GspH/FimT family pseudopilin [Pseudomonadales bacterium]